MKRVFVDANIVIDLLCERYPWFPKVLRIFSMGDLGQIDLFCSSLSLGTASYIMETLNAREVLVFKGRKQLSITRQTLADSKFFQTFIRRYTK